MIPKDGITPQYFKVLLKRRLWYIVLPFFIICLATIIHCIKAPKIYRSSTLILIQPQEVPASYVKPTVTSDVEARLNSITEQIMSRSRLEEIINKYNLYPEVRNTASAPSPVEIIRGNILTSIKSETGPLGRETPTAFEVSFMGKDPVKTRDVTRDLANLYIDYNYRLRAEQAAGTTKFLERELERMKEELREKEKLLREFKEEHIGFLPSQLENNSRILNQLQQQLDSINTTIQQTEDRKILLKDQLTKLNSLEGQEPITIEALRQQLQTLQNRYSEKHPDVISLKTEIANLEEQERARSSLNESGDAGGVLSQADTSQRLVRIQKDELLAQLKIIDKEILSLQKSRDKALSEIETYKERIESAPRIEQMLTDLERDYDQADKNYQSLLQKKLEAQLAENLERTQKGEQFKILDQAYLPVKPFKPNIRRILAMGFMMAICCGLSLAFMKDYFDPTLSSAKELEKLLEIPVLVSVPVIQTESERRRGTYKKSAAAFVLLAMSSALLYALFVLWRINPNLLPL